MPPPCKYEDIQHLPEDQRQVERKKKWLQAKMSNPVMAEMIRERNRVNKQAQRQRKKMAKDRVAEASTIPTSLPAPQGPPSSSPTFSTVAVMTDPPAGPTTAVAVRLRQMVNMGVMTESPATSSLEKLRCKSIYRVFALADESSTEAVASTMTADGATAHGAMGDDVPGDLTSGSEDDVPLLHLRQRGLTTCGIETTRAYINHSELQCQASLHPSDMVPSNPPPRLVNALARYVSLTRTRTVTH